MSVRSYSLEPDNLRGADKPVRHLLNMISIIINHGFGSFLIPRCFFYRISTGAHVPRRIDHWSRTASAAPISMYATCLYDFLNHKTRHQYCLTIVSFVGLAQMLNSGANRFIGARLPPRRR